MDLISLPYALFVLATVLLFHSCPAWLRPLFLSAASILFYGYYSPASAVVLVVMEPVGARRGILFLLVVAMLIGYLLLIKLLLILNQHWHAVSLHHMILALGVSYYTFKLLGYLIDVYWSKYSAWTDVIRFLAFATFFPQLPAGPIQRAPEFEMPTSGDDTSKLMTTGLHRILLGMVKKTLVADQLYITQA